MRKNLQISIVVAVYKREDELTELLESLARQTCTDFEVIVVDDGSPNPLEAIVKSFSEKLDIRYFYKENSGPAPSRNYGMSQAQGNYFVFLDSDTIAPKTYVKTVYSELEESYVDAFGGPDQADEGFTDLQKAISFSMTSFLTTGGIRGGKRHIGRFQPRSFNMGISKQAFEVTGGFGNLRIGEDPDLSMTLWERGFETRLFPEAKVFHKRRTSLRKFAQQVYQFGIARPILNQRHPSYNKITFWFPTVFLMYLSICLLGFVYALYRSLISETSDLEVVYSVLLSMPLLVYWLMIFTFSFIQFKSIKVSFLSIVSAMTQFVGYGFGFFRSWVSINVLKLNPQKVFPSHYL